jgi:hypothetical protein
MWTTLLIGVALGACWAYGAISERCELQTKENFKADRELTMAVCMRVFRLEAENAKLRLFIAAGEMGRVLSGLSRVQLLSTLIPAACPLFFLSETG